MKNELKSSIKDCFHSLSASKRFIRPDDISEMVYLDVETVLEIALAAGASYQLSKVGVLGREMKMMRLQYTDMLRNQHLMPIIGR